MLNAFIIYKQADPDPKLSFLDFNTAVVSELLLHESADDDDENVVRLTGRHFIAKIESTAKARPQKRCRVCYKKGVWKESRYQCPQCPSQPGLCLEDCYKAYHTKIKYWE